MDNYFTSFEELATTLDNLIYIWSSGVSVPTTKFSFQNDSVIGSQY